MSARIAFGRRLRELCLEQHLAQEKLAEIAGMHRNYVGWLQTLPSEGTK